MSEVAATRATNRRALLAFTGVLAALVLALAVVVVAVQRQQLREDAQLELETELELLGELASDALLRSDYAEVEGLVRRWVERHDYLVGIKATLPNGFVLVDARRPRAAVQPLYAHHEVTFAGRRLVALAATGDFAGRKSGFAAIVIQVAALAAMLILVLGWLLWWTLKRTALLPLEHQIRSRESKEHELLRRTAELETAVQELESFSYSVSHDLRGPLRAIDGFSHALTEDYGTALDATARDYIARIRVAAQRMGVLIDDLLALAKMTRKELTIEEVDLSALAREILARLAQTEPERGVECEVAEGMRVRGDPGLLAVVLDNLLRNAWKYTSRTGAARIRFDATVEDGKTVYCVRDNGAGFDMTYVDKLFLPFQRLHAPQEFPGSGIGLATVARIVKRHGGRVWAQGAPDQGASFCFTLGI